MTHLKPPTQGPHCDLVTVSQAGSNWHNRRGEHKCPNCLTSNANYMKVNRAAKGAAITVTVDEMLEFARAWNPEAGNQGLAVRIALESMLVGVQ